MTTTTNAPKGYETPLRVFQTLRLLRGFSYEQVAEWGGVSKAAVHAALTGDGTNSTLATMTGILKGLLHGLPGVDEKGEGLIDAFHKLASEATSEQKKRVTDFYGEDAPLF